MTAVAYPPPESAPRAEGAGSGDAGSTGEFDDDSLGEPWSVFGEPFAGWMALADSAAEVEQSVGDVMRSASQLARAAIEARIEELADGLITALSRPRSTDEPEARLAPEAVRRAVDEVLGKDISPLSPGLAAAQLAESVVELQEHPELLRAYVSEETTLGGHSFAGLSAQALLALGTRVGSEGASVTPPPFGTDPARNYYGEGASAPRWWLTASLELPDLLAGDKPVHCRRPQHSILGDRVRVIESTFNNLDVDDTLVTRDRVQPGTISDGYRATVNADYVTEFADIVGRPADQRSYVCRAIIEPDSRALRTIARTVASNGEEIKSVAAAAAETALRVILTAGPAGPVAAPLAGLLHGLPGILTDHLINALTRVLEPRSLPAWVISHTVIWSDLWPLSIFLVQCPDEDMRRMRLHGLTGREVSGLPEISAEYRNLPKRLYNYGRLMWGASRTDVTAEAMPTALWSVVDSRQQPVIWTNPELDSWGFRLLVPQRRDKARYVTALRADLRFT